MNEVGMEQKLGAFLLFILRENIVLLISFASTGRDKRHLSSWEKVK